MLSFLDTKLSVDALDLHFLKHKHLVLEIKDQWHREIMRLQTELKNNTLLLQTLSFGGSRY